MVPKIEHGKNITAAVLVAGAGIAGMQAALDLAEAGFKVYLVENEAPGRKRSAKGGAVARGFLCSISSKLLAVQLNNNIELIENACVEGIDGVAGNFQVSLGSAAPSSIKGKAAAAKKNAIEKLRSIAAGAVIFAPGFNSLAAPSGYDFQAELQAQAEKHGFNIAGTTMITEKERLPLAASQPGIFAAGGSGAPAVRDGLIQGSCAAALAAELLSPARGALVREKKYPAEMSVAADEPAVGIFICRHMLSGKKSAEGIIAGAQKMSAVVHAEALPELCSLASLQRVQEAIEEQGLNRVVAVTCNPEAHAPLYQEALAEAGLNCYLLEMPDRGAAGQVSDVLRMAVARARKLEPLKEVTSGVVQSGLVIGSGVSALTAALSLANQGFEVYLVEQGPSDGSAAARSLQKNVAGQNKIKIFSHALITSFAGHPGSYVTTITVNGAAEVLNHGIVIIETGQARDTLAALLKIPVAADGSYVQPSALQPLDLACGGMFACGNGDMSNSIIQGLAVAARAATILAKRELVLSSIISVVDPERCVACLSCVRECPYRAAAISEERVSFIEPAECRGCGICVSACPRRAIELKHCTDEQILAELAACMDVRS